MDWFSIDFSGDVARLVIRDEIGFSGGDVSELIGSIQPAREIELVINSHGGCALAAQEIYKAILGRTSQATITGMCGSAAVWICHAARHVRIAENGHMMIHSPRAWNFSNVAELRDVSDSLARLEHAYVDGLSKRGCDPEAVRAWLADGADHYFTPEESRRAGLVDEIYTPLASKPVYISDGSDKEAGTADAMPGGNQNLFFQLLAAHGPVRTKDPQKFLRELMAWGRMNVREP